MAGRERVPNRAGKRGSSRPSRSSRSRLDPLLDLQAIAGNRGVEALVKHGVSHRGDPSEREAGRLARSEPIAAQVSAHLHTGQRAARITEALGARALVVDDHVLFAPGAYRPEAPEGQQLIAHELAHVALGHEGIQRSEVPLGYDGDFEAFVAYVAGEAKNPGSNPAITTIYLTGWLDRLSDDGLYELLSALGRADALDDFVGIRSMRDYLRSRGLKWDVLFRYWEPSATDSAHFAAGFAAGVLKVSVIDAPVGVIELVQSLSVEEDRARLWEGLRAFASDPILKTIEGVEGTYREYEEHLFNLRFFEAGAKFAEITLMALSAVALPGVLKALGKAVKAGAKGMRKLLPDAASPGSAPEPRPPRTKRHLDRDIAAAGPDADIPQIIRAEATRRARDFIARYPPGRFTERAADVISEHFARTLNVNRTVDRAQFNPTHSRGAAAELREIRRLAADNDVVKIDAIPSSAGGRSPDFVVQRRLPDGSTRLEFHEVTASTKATRGRAPRGAGRAGTLSLAERSKRIESALKRKLDPGGGKSTQFDVDVDHRIPDAPAGPHKGVLTVHEFFGSMSVRDARAMFEAALDARRAAFQAAGARNVARVEFAFKESGASRRLVYSVHRGPGGNVTEFRLAGVLGDCLSHGSIPPHPGAPA